MSRGTFGNADKTVVFLHRRRLPFYQRNEDNRGGSDDARNDRGFHRHRSSYSISGAGVAMNRPAYTSLLVYNCSVVCIGDGAQPIGNVMGGRIITTAACGRGFVGECHSTRD